MVSLFKKTLFSILVLFCSSRGLTQNYHAVHGSSYAGSLGVGNNPSSIVNTPYAWDINLLATQLKYTTNAIRTYNYSLLSSASESQYLIRNGIFSRYGNLNFNTNLLNARIALNRQHAIAFGLNVRGYASLKTSPYNFIDTIKTLSHLLKINQNGSNYNFKFITSSWVEIFGTYSRTIWDSETDRFNAGITVKAMRGLSGAHASIKGVNTQFQFSGNVYSIISGEGMYGYNSAFDTWEDKQNNNINVPDFVKHTEGSLSVDLGLEYIIKDEAVTNFYDDDNYYEYEWKIGLSLLDLGKNSYKYGNKSRTVSGIQPNTDERMLMNKFNNVKSLTAFNDSLSGVVNNISALSGHYEIINPARMVLNVDRYLFQNYYLNAELSFNFSHLAGRKKHFIEETNLLTITPRWETRNYGAFIPIQYNTSRLLWVGGAFKAGPLLLGIHNWGNIFSKKKMHNGGGYLAIIIHPGRNTGEARNKIYDCPR